MNLRDQRFGNNLSKDTDTAEFREQSISRLQAELTVRLKTLKGILQSNNYNELGNYTLMSAYALNRVVVGAQEQDDISSTSDTL